MQCGLLTVAVWRCCCCCCNAIASDDDDDDDDGDDGGDADGVHSNCRAAHRNGARSDGVRSDGRLHPHEMDDTLTHTKAQKHKDLEMQCGREHVSDIPQLGGGTIGTNAKNSLDCIDFDQVFIFSILLLVLSYFKVVCYSLFSWLLMLPRPFDYK